MQSVPLPTSFGDVPFDLVTVYFKKREEGLGLRLKDIEGKLVVKGLTMQPSDPLAGKVHINDVIYAVNHMDSRSSSLAALLGALKWKPPVEDNITAASLAIMDSLIRVTFARPKEPIHENLN
jgi:hypothetical protein